MGVVFDELKRLTQEKRAEFNEFGSRGLDVLPLTPEVHDYCFKKVRWQMTKLFIRPFIFSILALICSAGFLYIRNKNGIMLKDESPYMLFVMAVLVFGIPLLAYWLFFEGYGKIKHGKYELYGGLCIHKKHGRNYYEVKMNGVYLDVKSLSYDELSLGYYHFILRIPSKKKTLYYFVYTDKNVCLQRTGDIYPEDV